MRGPLAVRINDGSSDRHVTRHVSGLKFRKTAPGGYAGGSMKINRPLSTFPGLGPADKVYIYDARTGATVMEGYTENPGATDGPSGQSFDLSFLGNIILAADESRALMYVDNGPSSWKPLQANTASTQINEFDAAASAEAGTGGVPGWQVQFPHGITIGTNAWSGISYYGLANLGIELACLRVRLISGKNDTGYQQEFAWSGAGGAGAAILLNAISTTGSTYWPRAGAEFAVGSTVLHLGFRRTGGATNIADGVTFTQFQSLVVVGQRLNRTGSRVTADTTLTVLASQVVEDLVGRLMRFVDPVSSQIDPSTWPIDQLSYLDGANAAQVLDGLALYEPDMVWELLHSTPRGVMFRYRAWPTTPRYEVSVQDGYTAPGGEYDLCNRIAVYWTNGTGDKQSTVIGAYVPELGNMNPVLGGALNPSFVGRVKDAEAVTLPDGHGSAANAQRIGEQALAAKNRPPKAGKVTIRRPILDRLTGNTVMPWQLEPGYLMTVREVGDTLRMTEMEYDDDSCSATVTLGEPTLTMEQRLARLSKVIR